MASAPVTSTTSSSPRLMARQASCMRACGALPPMAESISCAGSAPASKPRREATSSAGFDRAPSERRHDPDAVRPPDAARRPAGAAPPGAAPSQSSAAARSARTMSSSGSGRSAGSSPASGGVDDLADADHDGGARVDGHGPRSVPVDAPGAPRRPGTLGGHARRRRLGSRRVRPQGDPEGRTWPRWGHDVADHGTHDPAWPSTTPTSGRRWAGRWPAGWPSSASASAGPATASPWRPTRSPGSGPPWSTTSPRRRWPGATTTPTWSASAPARPATAVALDALAAFLGGLPRSTGATTVRIEKLAGLDRELVHTPVEGTP